MNYRSGGRVNFESGGRNDSGKWWIKGDKLMCFQPSQMQRGKMVCMAFVRVGNHLKRYRGKSGKPAPGADWIIARTQ